MQICGLSFLTGFTGLTGLGFSSSFVPKFLLEVTELGLEKILCLSCILWFKNGIIFAYRWRGESRAVAAWKGARVEIEKAH